MQQITPLELARRIADGEEMILIDVREAHERAAYNIGGIHIPLGEIIGRRNELPTSTPAILYCEKGIRSAIAIQRLESAGFTNLINLSGGMSEWKRMKP